MVKMVKIEETDVGALKTLIDSFWRVSADKIRLVDREYDFSQGSPVFTRKGTYTTRGWTEWTEGFVYGSAVLQYDAVGDDEFLELGRQRTVERMAKHVTHIGVHDHGFNNVSTYGNLLRLMLEGRIPGSPWERSFYELALKCSGAVQAARWSECRDGGYIYSFNGPHSLFADTIRSLRALAVAHQLGQVLMGEGDQPISLLDRLITHAETTARYIVYYGDGRDAYDVRGRTVHEAIFNMNDGRFRCPSTQQGYSPFSTWTRGLSWIITGYAEQLEFLDSLSEDGNTGRVLDDHGGKAAVHAMMEKAAVAAADFYLTNTPTDFIPYWDTGAPGLAHMGTYLDEPADPFNDHEPVDSSAAAIAAQGLLRLARTLDRDDYRDAAVKIVRTLLDEPYLSTDPSHQGLLLHSVYHRPNGWDYVPEAAPGSSGGPGAQSVPSGESCMWGDYHIREAVLHLQRIIEDNPYYSFRLPLERTQ